MLLRRVEYTKEVAVDVTGPTVFRGIEVPREGVFKGNGSD